jgi:hypothetical protein
MVRGAVVVKVPAVQAAVDAEATVNPAGRTSENETPVKDVVVFGFVIVKVNVLVLPVPMEVGEKLLERLGTVGRAQPVKTILSRRTVEVVFAEFRVSAWIVKRVVLAPVVAAVAVAPVSQEPLAVTTVVGAEKAPPSALE